MSAQRGSEEVWNQWDRNGGDYTRGLYTVRRYYTGWIVLHPNNEPTAAGPRPTTFPTLRQAKGYVESVAR